MQGHSIKGYVCRIEDAVSSYSLQPGAPLRRIEDAVSSYSSQLIDKIGAVANCAYDTFSSFGMKLNFSTGKS